ncbi:endonuclease/exonuclease/phosphatase family protein [Penaeicola halotolerans]|uniref:endonuclease/exonuclease/phosphatase family protein n=1 Tax=Penaeicola halotolerans TaxID=2793196 RepID=UPI001CF92E41|nr:endonuclease/exonuclease/phosphatase family protein [Penaeicola halotolerans]
MKKHILLIYIFCIVSSYGISQTLSVATYNIKFDDKRDTINNWSNRLPQIIGLIKHHQLDIIGTQEGLKHQLEDLKDGLLSYEYIGVGREDGINKGEFSAIFYNTEKVKVSDSGNFWLSETPDKPSVGWDAAMERICTWVRFETISDETTQVFYVFNAHFDHVGREAQINSTKLILEQIPKIIKNEEVILMGDFNITPQSEAYENLKSSTLTDSYISSASPPYGPIGTFNAFDWQMKPTRRIDYIWTSQNLIIKKYAVITDNYGLKYPSDHFPVRALISFVKK